MKSKKCSSCQRVKSTSKFWRNRSRHDGYQAVCKGCLKEANNKSREEKRKEVFEYLCQHPCVDCGLADPVLLVFDHVRGKKVGGVGELLSNGVSRERIWREIAKCVVRCFNCHRLRTVKQFGHLPWLADMPVPEAGPRKALGLV